MRTVAALLLLVACDDSYKEPLKERYTLLCRFEASCAESTAGLDCDAYEAQLEVHPDPCLVYDDFYIEPCLEQLRDLVDEVAYDPASCGGGVDGGAPACTQAFVASSGGRCPG
jgi:hypothetical protein